MASEPEPGHVVCSAQRGTRLARTLFVSRRPKAQLIRTAVYGTVRTVVWEGWMSDCPPYPDQDWLPHAGQIPKNGKHSDVGCVDGRRGCWFSRTDTVPPGPADARQRTRNPTSF